MTTDVDTDAIMTDLQQRVRERLRVELLEHGVSEAFEDPQLFAAVERLLRRASSAGDAETVLLTEVLGDPATWRLQTAMRYQSHRGRAEASLLVFIKQRVLMPMFRWLFEYSRDNFERQQRVNLVLFACVRELVVETTQLRRQLEHQSPPPAGPVSQDRAPR